MFDLDDIFDLDNLFGLFRTLGIIAAVLIAAFLGITYFPKVLPIIGYQTETDFGIVSTILPTHGLAYAYLREGDKVIIDYETNIEGSRSARISFIKLNYPVPTIWASSLFSSDAHRYREVFRGVGSGTRTIKVEQSGMYWIRIPFTSLKIKPSITKQKSYTLKWRVE